LYSPTNLTSGNWTPVASQANPPGGGGINSLIDANTAGAQAVPAVLAWLCLDQHKLIPPLHRTFFLKLLKSGRNASERHRLLHVILRFAFVIFAHEKTNGVQTVGICG
jgi:hypothetical protein